MSETESLLEKAGRSFDAAEALLEEHADFAASRAYYGCFYIAQALLRSSDMLFARHGQVIAQYGLHFAKTGVLDPRFHTLLIHAFSLRQSADYEADAAVESQSVITLIREGRQFLAAATEHLNSQV